MTIQLIELSSSTISASIDPGQGADVLSLVDLPSGIDVLFRTPWRERADAIRAGAPATLVESRAAWHERYRGGWQTLCPNLGDARTVHGAPVGFHGEAAIVEWAVDEITPDSARLHVELFTVPIRIDRTVTLVGSKLTLADTLTNLSSTDLEFDYSQHPAFGGAFLNGACRIDSGATRFTADGDVPAPLPTEMPGPGSHATIFGWLGDFERNWATITNTDLDLAVRIEWEGQALRYAWVWQELNGSPEFPWYARARAVAIEPATTVTSGPGRSDTLRMPGLSSTELSVSVSVENGAQRG